MTENALPSRRTEGNSFTRHPFRLPGPIPGASWTCATLLSFVLVQMLLGHASVLDAAAQPPRSIGLTTVPQESAGASSPTRQDWVTYLPDEEADNGKHIVLLSGDEEYRSEEALPMLGQILAKRHGFKCTVLFAIDPETGEIAPNNQQNIPNMKVLASADLVIMALRFRNLPDSDMEHVDAYLKQGKPVIGLRTSTHAFRLDETSGYHHYTFNSQKWPGGFGKQVLGETWIQHHGAHKRESTRGIINQQFSDHPILSGVADVWGNTDVYAIRDLTADAKVLLHGQVLQGMSPDDEPVPGRKNDPMMPLAWLKPYQLEGGQPGQAFCTTMGSSTDLANEGLRRLIVNATFYLLEMPERLGGHVDVDFVRDYEPTMYGFNTFKKGLKPSDFDLDN